MTQIRTIRVMIIDNQDLLRVGIAAFLTTCSDIELVGETSLNNEALRMCELFRPDVLVMDFVDTATGAAIIRTLRERCPESKIIVLTANLSEAMVTAAIEAGALSYLLKDVSTDSLAAAIRDAALGKSTLAREAAQALVSATQRAREPEFRLTRRERQVLSLMTRGYNNGQIAEYLTISRSTAKKHVSNILAKLNTSSRTEAVAVAVQNHLESA